MNVWKKTVLYITIKADYIEYCSFCLCVVSVINGIGGFHLHSQTSDC